MGIGSVTSVYFFFFFVIVGMNCFLLLVIYYIMCCSTCESISKKSQKQNLWAGSSTPLPSSLLHKEHPSTSCRVAPRLNSLRTPPPSLLLRPPLLHLLAPPRRRQGLPTGARRRGAWRSHRRRSSSCRRQWTTPAGREGPTARRSGLTGGAITLTIWSRMLRSPSTATGRTRRTSEGLAASTGPPCSLILTRALSYANSCTLEEEKSRRFWCIFWRCLVMNLALLSFLYFLSLKDFVKQYLVVTIGDFCYYWLYFGFGMHDILWVFRE